MKFFSLELYYFHLAFLAICVAEECLSRINFNRDHFGKKMNGHLVKVMQVNGLTRCVYECLVTPKCLSLNFYPDLALCELNSEDSVTSSSSLVDYDGHVTYTDIAVWPTSIAKLCSGSTCTPGQRCTPALIPYTCLRDECESPPAVLDATLTSDSTMRGMDAFATYQCENGLTLRGNPSITCRERFLWSDVSFRCALANVTLAKGRFPKTSSQLAYHWSTGVSFSVPGTCKELKHCNSTYTADGEYWLYPALYNPTSDVTKVKVYCRDQSTDEPKEYITLSGTNNAVYDNREALYYWERDPSGNPSCAISSGTIRKTTFQKIRLNPQDMTIMNDDFTYSSTTGGEAMKYGTGGDCTYAHGCLPRKGYFHIDTSNTGLIVDKTISWVGTGWNPKLHDFSRSEDGTLIEIQCGGKCGGCQPERAMNLIINTEEVLPDDSATIPVCG